MKISEKILLDHEGLQRHGPINIVIFGDSVSHGGLLNTIDYENVYWNRLKKKLNAFRDYVPVNMICASIGGTTAMKSVERLERQVLRHEPDLVIVSFGLNDVNKELEDYLGALREIFTKCKAAGSDVIFMTPNMLNTYVAEDTEEKHLSYAHKTAEMQNSGRMDTFMSAAVALAQEMDVTVCDCYARWKKLAETEDTTLMLINRINHPTSEMHELFAESLYEMLLPQADAAASDSTMYKG